MTNTPEIELLPAKHRNLVLLAVSLVAIMVQVDYTAVNLSLVAMSKTIHADLTTLQWVLSAYVLAWGSMVISAGRMADLYGKRRMFLLGNVLFLAGSALSGFATSAWFLIASRILQGIGGAIFLPALYTLIFTAFPGNERGRAMGILTSAFAVGMAIGPTLGGIILHLLSWRYIFFVNIPIGILIIGIILKSLPKEPKKLLDEPMDYIGSFLLALTFIALMSGISLIQSHGLDNGLTLFYLVGAAVLFILTLVLERNIRHPILNLNLFRNRAFLGCIFSYILMGYNFAAILIIGGLYLQNIQGYSSFDSGLIFLAMTSGLGILSVYSGRLCDVIDKRILIGLGGTCLIVGTLIFACLGTDSPLWAICLMFFLVGLGFGIAFPALNLAMMNVVNEKEINVASGTFTMFGCLGNTIGLILSSVSIVYFGQNTLFHLFEQAQFSLSSAQIQALTILMASAQYAKSSLNAFQSTRLPEVLNLLHQAFVHAMSHSLLIAMMFAALGIVIGVLLIKETR